MKGLAHIDLPRPGTDITPSTIVRVCTLQPVFTIVIMLLFILCGEICRRELPTARNPRTASSSITLEIQFPGADSNTMEQQINNPAESVFASIVGVEEIQSEIQNGTVRLHLILRGDANVEQVLNDVREAWLKLKSHLPHNIQEMRVYKTNTKSVPCMNVMATYVTEFDEHGMPSPITHDQAAKTHAQITKIVKPFCERLGAAKVEIIGGKEVTLYVVANLDTLAKYNLTLTDIAESLRESENLANGRIIQQKKNLEVRVRDHDPDIITLIQNIPIRLPSGLDNYVMLGSLATISFNNTEHQRSFAMYNGTQTLIISIYHPSSESPVPLCQAIKAQLPHLESRIPHTKLEIVKDESIEIIKAIDGVYRALIEAMILVTLAVILSLAKLRPAIMPIAALIVSIFSSFIFMKIFGCTINIVTLLAIVLAVGIVVDDAIVVLENVYYRMEQGMSSLQASLIGTTEILPAIITMTLTLCAVFIPILFLRGGDLVRKFMEFAITLTGSVLVSGFVSITLTPMMCAHLLQYHKEDNLLLRWMQKIQSAYAKSLTWTFDNAISMLKIAIMFAIASYLIGLAFLPSEDTPKETDDILVFGCVAPVDSSSTRILEYMESLGHVFTKINGIKNYFLTSDNTHIRCTLYLQPSDQVNRGQILEDLRLLIEEEVHIESHLSLESRETIRFAIQSSEPNEALLVTKAHEIIGALKQKDPSAFTYAIPVHTPPIQSVNVAFHPLYYATSHIPVHYTMQNLSYALMPTIVAYKKYNDEKIPIVAYCSQHHTIGDIGDMVLRGERVGSHGNREIYPVLARSIIKKYPDYTPPVLFRYGLARALQVMLIPPPGHGIAKCVDLLLTAQLPEGFSLELMEKTREYVQNRGQITFLFLLSILFIYLFLSAQFNSFITPLGILLTVPFSVSGSIIVLLMAQNGSFNTYSKLGILTLIALITKHGILLVDKAEHYLYALRRKKDSAAMSDDVSDDVDHIEGQRLLESMDDSNHPIIITSMQDVWDAVQAIKVLSKSAAMDASVARLRPILMTTLSMVFGAIPLALGQDEMKKQIGLVIACGMTVGTIFTIFILPLMYMYIHMGRIMIYSLLSLAMFNIKSSIGAKTH